MDQWRKLFFQASGAEFHPNRMGLAFSNSFEPGAVATFGGHRGQVVAFGGALYQVPNHLPADSRASQLETALAHLAVLLPAFRAAGATKFILHMNRTFQGRYNEEFTRSELQALAALDCHFFYGADRGDA